MALIVDMIIKDCGGVWNRQDEITYERISRTYHNITLPELHTSKNLFWIGLNFKALKVG